jgi:acetyl-CoA C-acetyltransferase
MQAETIAVIVGVGQINDRPSEAMAGLDSCGLMAEALRRADTDAGGGWLGDLDQLASVDQISFPDDGSLVRRLARDIGADGARVETTDLPHGDSPVRLLNEASLRIARGEARIVAVAGGEAMITASAQAKVRAKVQAKAGGLRPGDILRGSAKRKTSPLRQAYGLNAPVDMYPIYENALRHLWRQSLAEGQAETAQLWSGMAAVAQNCPDAWIRTGATENKIVTDGATNRRIAHPYTKLMVANASVNQGAGFLVTSLAEAQRRNVPLDQLVYVGQGAAAKEPAEFLDRESYARSLSMEEVLRATLEFNDLTADELEMVALYSCFPCVPKMARRVLDWPADRPITSFGGLTFGGAPVANYMSHAIATMVQDLRGGDQVGLLYANGGIVTTNHAIVLSGGFRAGMAEPKDFDVQARADARRGLVPVLDADYTGPAVIESWTVFYNRENLPSRGVVIARSPAGDRCLAFVPAEDQAAIDVLTDGRIDPVGRAGQIVPAQDLRRFLF